MPGLKLRKRNWLNDHRRFSFHRTFGTAPQLVDIDLDRTLSNFNQNLPNPVTGGPALPEGCTAFARCDTATNEDRIIYDPQFTYEKSCEIENVPLGSPLHLETAYESARTDGLKAVSEAPGMELLHRRGPPLWITLAPGQDYFDAIWSALVQGRRPVSLGTPWFPEITAASVVDQVTIRPTDDGHAYEVCGVQTTDQPRMKVKWWGGEPKWFGRAAVNALMSVPGSEAMTDVDGKATPADLQSVGFIALLQHELLNFLQRLYALTTGS